MSVGGSSETSFRVGQGPLRWGSAGRRLRQVKLDLRGPCI